jgi:hypothetical protein
VLGKDTTARLEVPALSVTDESPRAIVEQAHREVFAHEQVDLIGQRDLGHFAPQERDPVVQAVGFGQHFGHVDYGVTVHRPHMVGTSLNSEEREGAQAGTYLQDLVTRMNRLSQALPNPINATLVRQNTRIEAKAHVSSSSP